MYTRKKMFFGSCQRVFTRYSYFNITHLTLHKHPGIMDKGFRDTQVDLRFQEGTPVEVLYRL